jgi:predicted RecB family endonuclease
MRARRGVLESRFSPGIAQAIDGFFAECRDRLDEAVAVIEESKASATEAARRFATEYGLTPPEIVPFGPERFALELGRLEALCARELKRGTAMLLRPHTALAELFFESIAVKAVHVFEIAEREARAWIGAFIRPLEAELSVRQERTNSRIEGIGRMQDAEGDLVQRLEDVKGLVRELAAMRDEMEAHAARLERQLG